MISYITKILGLKKAKKSHFLVFFTDLSSAKKKKVLKEVVKKANDDQKAIVEKYNQTMGVRTSTI